MNIPSLMQACMVRMRPNDVPGATRPVEIFEVRSPDLDSMPRTSILLKLRYSGACVTNLEIAKGFYGHPPAKTSDCLLNARGLPLVDWLTTGHEGSYEVLAVGRHVLGVKVGDCGAITVRPGCDRCRNCRAGYPNKCVSGVDTLTETGIHIAHGSDMEYKIIDQTRFVPAPPGLGALGLWAEPWSIDSHAYDEASSVWRLRNPGVGIYEKPRTVAILGAGPIGIGLAMKCIREGIHPVVIARSLPSSYRAQLALEIGATYVSTEEASGENGHNLPLRELIPYIRKNHTNVPLSDTGFEWVFEASGSDHAIAHADELVADGGVLVWTSITGNERAIEAPIARMNIRAVLGNQSRVGVVNAHAVHFQDALQTMGYAKERFPGWPEKLNTHPYQGIAGCKEMLGFLGLPANQVPANMMKTFAEID